MCNDTGGVYTTQEYEIEVNISNGNALPFTQLMTPDGKGDYCGSVPYTLLEGVKQTIINEFGESDYWAIPKLIEVFNWCIRHQSDLHWS